ncbi:MAG: hypothetical protein ACWIPH_01965 [Ostreibacterium sp.]
MNEAISIYPWHQTVLNHIKVQLHHKRMPQATLFRRRSGYFDTQLGWQVVQYILCDKQNLVDECRHCQLVVEHSHPNVLFLDVHHDKIGISQIRELEQQMWQTAMFDKFKVAFISGADLLSVAAQNALLKTLEEPPQNVFFILSVDNVSRVLPTIMSRVQRLQHGKVNKALLLHWLQPQLPQAVTQVEIAKIAKLVDFSPEYTLALFSSTDALHEITQEKTHFAAFMTGKMGATELVAWMDKEQIAPQLVRYRRYTEHMVRFLFSKITQQTDKYGGDSVQYPTWNGVTLRRCYRLLDKLADLWYLADTNVNIILQLTTSLTEWQNDKRN